MAALSFVWLIWFIWFIWLVSFNKNNQTNKTNQINQMHQPLLSLRQIAPAGFLTQVFAVDEPAGCQS
jgi:hypothetical protein